MPRRKTNIAEISNELANILEVLSKQAAIKIFEFGFFKALQEKIDLSFTVPWESFRIEKEKVDPQSVNDAIQKAAGFLHCVLESEEGNQDLPAEFRFRLKEDFIKTWQKAKAVVQRRKHDESRWLEITQRGDFPSTLLRFSGAADRMGEFDFAALLAVRRGFFAVRVPMSEVVLGETSGDAASAEEATGERGAASEARSIVFIAREGAGPESVLPILIAARLAKRGFPVLFERWRGRNRKRRWRVSGIAERAVARFDALPSSSEDAETKFPERAYRIVHAEGSGLLGSAKLAQHGQQVVILLPPYFDPGFALKIWRARKRLAENEIFAAPVEICDFPCYWCHPTGPRRSIVELWEELCWECSIPLLPETHALKMGFWSWSPILSPLFGAAAERVELEFSELEANGSLESLLRALSIP